MELSSSSASVATAPDADGFYSFPSPTIFDNAEGWGPSLTMLPSKFRDIPYAPYSKSDRLGRAADLFSSQGSKYGGGPGAADDMVIGAADGDGASMGDDTRAPGSAAIANLAGFVQVADAREKPHKYGMQGKQGGYGGGRGGQAGANVVSGRAAQYSSTRKLMDERGELTGNKARGRGGFAMRGGGRGGSNSRGGGAYRPGWKDQRWEERVANPLRDSVLKIADDWQFVTEMSFTQLSKMRFEKVVEGVDVVSAGKVKYYDRAVDRVNSKNTRPIQKFPKREFHYVTTTDDPVIRKLAGQNEATIYATSSIISLLMVSPRTAFGWDIVVQRVGNKLFFDKRESSMIDFLTVNETRADYYPEERNADSINSDYALAVEATTLNQNFSQSVLRKDNEEVVFEEPDPFAEPGEDVAPTGYKYRKWVFPDNRTVLVRCEVNAAMDGAATPQLAVVKSLLEYPGDSRSDWRSKLDTQRGSVFATEIKNNAGKLARWTAEALLANADSIKFGFVSRANPKDNSNHVLLATQIYKPKEFATQIALTPNNMWGVFLHIVDLCYRYMDETGKAVIRKDPT
eukprot:CAMPEP_0184708002 /NCGR_PEP_ID=MMETSP0313-20130426/37551_1 /TAXON_ID=2792 /ORGANISM="Porphyridium aerugineum, Strain SAG 1380-2" /LENGTH=570 /DNA_ID=CAMNT_0027169583 /DNA_START=2898 /DNA_END=4606 /DNA_ORIENTATION=+